MTTDRRTRPAPPSPTLRGPAAARHRPGGSAAQARPSRGVAAEALVLREWALRLLGEQAGPPDALWETVARCEPVSWAVFLRLECCSLALQTRLDALDAWPRLPTGAASILRRHAMSELRRVLSARAQIKTTARLAGEHDWKVILLKGGAAVAEGELLDLHDVDILVAPDRAADVAAALDALGYKPLGVDVETAHHLAERSMPNSLKVEVHRRVKNGGGLADFLSAAVPLHAEPPLLAMGPADNVRYLLRHATEQHPERIGRLRDLLLIAHALRACSPEQIADIEHELDERADETAGAMLSVALRLAGRVPDSARASADPFAWISLRRSVVFHRLGHWFDDERGMAILARTLRMIGQGRAGWWSAFGALFRIPADATPPIRAVARVHRRSRLLGNTAWRIARLVSFGTASMIALWADLEARWIEARGLGHGSGHGPDRGPEDGPRGEATTEPVAAGSVRETDARTGPAERAS